MIDKEMCRNDLSEICNNWGVTTDDYDDFMAAAMVAIKYQNGEHNHLEDRDAKKA
jgi:hypothetical protein